MLWKDGDGDERPLLRELWFLERRLACLSESVARDELYHRQELAVSYGKAREQQGCGVEEREGQE